MPTLPALGTRTPNGDTVPFRRTRVAKTRAPPSAKDASTRFGRPR